LQAGKLAAIAVTVLFATLAVFGPLAGQVVSALFMVVQLCLLLVAVVAAETLSAVYRSVRAGGPLSARLAADPRYAAVRATEVLFAALSVGAYAYLFSVVVDEPPAGPGAVGLTFVAVGIGLLTLAGSFLRGVTELVRYRRDSPA
jgi:hypothetical protein